MTQSRDIPGFIIAGGNSSRMGGAPKGMLLLGGKPVLAHITERFGPQVTSLHINSNLPGAALRDFDLPVLSDLGGPDRGPLSGLLTCLTHAAKTEADADWIATVPWDCPFVPRDLVVSLARGAAHADAAIATSCGRQHPLAGLWRTALLPQLTQAFEGDGIRSLKAWLAGIDVAQVAFAGEPLDPFFNINTPEDLARAEALANEVGLVDGSEGNGTASLDRTGDL